jgi:hypothetical protein
MRYSLNAIQQLALKAAINRIIPADDFPGAWDAGVADYITGQLNRDLRHLAASFSDGLAQLDAQSITQFAHPLADLPPDQQDLVLRSLESTPFFTLLLNLAIEGYYSDPGNLGNRGQISWKMIGYDPRGQTRTHP